VDDGLDSCQPIGRLARLLSCAYGWERKVRRLRSMDRQASLVYRIEYTQYVRMYISPYPRRVHRVFSGAANSHHPYGGVPRSRSDPFPRILRFPGSLALGTVVYIGWMDDLETVGRTKCRVAIPEPSASPYSMTAPS